MTCPDEGPWRLRVSGVSVGWVSWLNRLSGTRNLPVSQLPLGYWESRNVEFFLSRLDHFDRVLGCTLDIQSFTHVIAFCSGFMAFLR